MPAATVRPLSAAVKSRIRWSVRRPSPSSQAITGAAFSSYVSGMFGKGEDLVRLAHAAQRVPDERKQVLASRFGDALRDQDRPGQGPAERFDSDGLVDRRSNHREVETNKTVGREGRESERTCRSRGGKKHT